MLLKPLNVPTFASYWRELQDTLQVKISPCRLFKKQIKRTLEKESTMKNLEITGLKNNKKVVEGLQQLLADFHVYFANLRGYHWNIKGAGFFNLHEKFEELYDMAADQIDEIAERLLQLDEVPENKIDKLAKKAKLTAKGEPEPEKAMIKHLLEDMQYMIESVRTVAGIAEEAGDKGTADMIGGYLPGFEKNVWMLNSYIA